MSKTKKEHIYLKTLENTRDRLDDFEEQYANKEVYSAFDELTGIVEKGLSQASKIPVSTDKLSVEKLLERCDRYEKALKEISKTKVPFRNGCFHWEDFSEDALKAQKVLAAIGGDDE